ncbi:MAG: FecR family protein [Proteobacteria bacterium]|nr:FecR family protein [Pseudomonadota bacterium]
MKKSASIQIIALLLLFCIITPISTALAESQAVATVVALRGTAVAQNKDGASRNLSLKSQLFQEDVLKTGNNGKLQIMFTDNSIISLSRDSEMKIAEYRWEAGRKDGALTMQVKEGTFRVMGGALAKDAPHNFKTETPTATIGIRGSMYAFKSTQESLSVVFQGGKGIEVFNDHGKVSITIPGFGTNVVLNAPPEPPVKFTEQQINDLNSETNGNGDGTNGDGTGGDGGGTGTGNESGDGDTGTTDPPAPTVPPKPVVPPVNEFPSGQGSILTPPPPPPTDGVFSYEGVLGGVSRNPTTDEIYDTFTNTLSLGVNWHNRRMLGVAYDSEKENPVFFFGSVTGATITDFTIFGGDELTTNHDPGFITGNGIGIFTGPTYGLFSFAASGKTYYIQNSNVHDNWLAAGGGQKVSTDVPSAPTGSSDWIGFVTGLSALMPDPASDPYPNLYTSPVGIYQSGLGGIAITLDKDVGTISGEMTPGNDISGNGFSTLSYLQVGGSTADSVYVRDDLMAALIDGCPDDCFPLTLKTHGNAMVTADPKDQFSSHVTWGYWEIAYTDSANGGSDRIMAPSSSLWIAGSNPTNNTVITTGFTGTYSGDAVGTKMDATGTTSLKGTCDLTANFNAGANYQLEGNIALPGITFTITNPSSIITATASSNSFTAAITAANGYSGGIKGAFFGSAAEAVGGNFFSTNGTTSYLGIFGGNKTSGSLAAN